MQTKLQVRNLRANCIDAVRRDMSECGFALVHTPFVFDEESRRRVSGPRTEFYTGDRRWWRFPDLARYACWLETLLETALPEEAVSLTSLDFRHEPAGFEDQEVDRLHADGSYIRSVYTLYGPTTIYRDQGIERSVPEGQTLLMTAMGRAKAIRRPCTLHRRPGPGPERALIVCSFEPAPQPSPPARIYREAVHADSRRRKPREGRIDTAFATPRCDALSCC